jgi:hypothetical protein
MVELVSELGDGDSAVGGTSGDGYESLAALNDGFLGTGHSTGVELSLIVLFLIVGYVGMSLLRYFLPEFRPLRSVASVLGLHGS